jgi:hypothetical protein
MSQNLSLSHDRQKGHVRSMHHMRRRIHVIWGGGGGYTSYEEEDTQKGHVRSMHDDGALWHLNHVPSSLGCAGPRAGSHPARLSAVGCAGFGRSGTRERCFYWDKVIGGRFPRRTCLQNSHSQRERCLDLHRLIGVPHESSSSYDACLLG